MCATRASRRERHRLLARVAPAIVAFGPLGEILNPTCA
jgi:hypothetical protein